jgi:hypothetical protein
MAFENLKKMTKGRPVISRKSGLQYAVFHGKYQGD